MTVQKIDDIETNQGLQAAQVAEQNDAFRAALADADIAWANRAAGIEGKVLLTPGIAGHATVNARDVIQVVAAFSEFDDDNDPYGDHCFGAVTVSGERFLWKIDYYDQAYEYGAARPWDVSETRRVLTIMTPIEY